MKISIDGRGINLYRGTGIGTYTYNLLKNLIKIDNENSYTIYWCGDNYEEFEADNTDVILCSKGKNHKFFDESFIPNNLRENNIDLYHIPQNGIGYNDFIPCKSIVTIHDLIPYIMPETVGKGYLLKFLREMPAIIERSSKIITVSSWSKKDILKFFPVDESKIFPIPLAADKKFHPLDREICKSEILKNYNIDCPFILYLGGFSPRKNVKSLITGFSRINNKDERHIKLLILGSTKGEGEYLLEFSKELSVENDVIFLGFIPEEHLPCFYNACEIFVYPSIYEGFGLPPLEAMSCGAAVITSNISSIPEVVEDAGVLINPFNVNEIKDSIERLIEDPSQMNKYRKLSLEKSKKYSWEETAKKTLEVYQNINK